MRVFLSIFLFFTIVSSVVISVRQQVDDIAVCKFIEYEDGEDSKDDLNEKSPIEKDLFTYKVPQIIHFKDWSAFNNMTDNNRYDEDLIGSLYRFLPYVPPK